MTKTAIIEYNEVDEMLIHLFFKKLRVKVKTSDTPLFDKLSPQSQQLLRDMNEAIAEGEAIARGEEQPEQTYQEYLAELKALSNANRTLETV